MSDKRNCPACDVSTSAIRMAFDEGEPCPYCGLPAEVAEAFERAQGRGVEQGVIDRMVAAESRRVVAEQESHRLRGLVNDLRSLIRRFDDIEKSAEASHE